MLLSIAQEWNLKLSSCKIWSGLIYNTRNSWQEATGNAASVIHIVNVYHICFCLASGRMYWFHVLSPIQLPMRLRQQTIQTHQVIIFSLFTFVCLFVFFSFVPFITSKVENQYVLSSIPSWQYQPLTGAGLSSDTFPSKIYFRYENSWWEGEK